MGFGKNHYMENFNFKHNIAIKQDFETFLIYLRQFKKKQIFKIYKLIDLKKLNILNHTF